MKTVAIRFEISFVRFPFYNKCDELTRYLALFWQGIRKIDRAVAFSLNRMRVRYHAEIF